MTKLHRVMPYYVQPRNELLHLTLHLWTYADNKQCVKTHNS